MPQLGSIRHRATVYPAPYMKVLISRAQSARVLFFRLVAALALGALALAAVAQSIDPTARGKIMDAIKAKYKSLASLPTQKRRAATIAFMKSFEQASTAAVSDDGNLCCIFRDHMTYSILLSVQQPGPPKEKPVALLPAPIAEEWQAQAPEMQVPLFASTSPSFGWAQAGGQTTFRHRLRPGC